MTVAFGHFACITLTGASMNPGRTFGSALAQGHWQNHWIYWMGPSLGGITAALLYSQVLSAPKEIERITDKYGEASAKEV